MNKSIKIIIAIAIIGIFSLTFINNSMINKIFAKNNQKKPNNINSSVNDFFDDNIFNDDFFSNNFEDNFFEDMKNIKQKMKRIISDDNFFSDPFSSAYGKNINIDETKNKLIIHATLPDKFNASNIKVTIKNDDILSLSADIEKNQKKDNFNSSEKRIYRQIISLPCLVDKTSMKIDLKDNQIIINIKKQTPGYYQNKKENDQKSKEKKNIKKDIYDEPENFI